MERDRHTLKQSILVHIDPLVQEGFVPLLGERTVHHLTVDCGHGDEFISTVAEGSVGCLHRADECRHDEGSVFPAAEHLRTFTDQLGWIAAHRLDRITERQDVIDTRLAPPQRLGSRRRPLCRTSRPPPLSGR